MIRRVVAKSSSYAKSFVKHGVKKVSIKKITPKMTQPKKWGRIRL